MERAPPLNLAPDTRPHEYALEVPPSGPVPGVLCLDRVHYFFGQEPGGYWVSRFATDRGSGLVWHVRVADGAAVSCDCPDLKWRRRRCKHCGAIDWVLSGATAPAK